MTFRIGLPKSDADTKQDETAVICADEQTSSRRSVVQVWFPERRMHLAYYNDRFDLKCGDIVYVDGKLEGYCGRVTEVNYNFKIRMSDYKRVTAVVDTAVRGQVFLTGTHYVAFERDVLPIDKVSLWFKAPNDEDEEFIVGYDDTVIELDDLSGMNVSSAIAARGQSYYDRGKVRYLCVDGTKGYAIVSGSKPYEVEFEYKNGQIGKLVCSCFCSYNCKHEYAVLLELRTVLSQIKECCADEYERADYFAAIRGSVYDAVIRGEKGDVL